MRYTYDVPHIPAEFKRAEYLGPAGRVIAGRYMFRVSWDGSLKVKGILAASRDGDVRECELAELNIRDIPDAGRFMADLEASH